MDNTTTLQELRYDAQVIVITGAGNGLGRAYAHFFASRGATVIVNDVGVLTTPSGRCEKAADVVVDEIRKLGGKALANYDSVEDGHNIIDATLRAFDRVDVLINNAGIVRVGSLESTTQADWEAVMNVNLNGSFKCARAVWPHMIRQRYGRIINTSSIAGLFGIPHQAGYAATKAAQIGMSQTLANEGFKHNILVNTIAPLAASKMLEPFLPPNLLEALQMDLIVPLVAVLVHSTNVEVTGALFEAGGGHFAQIRPAVNNVARTDSPSIGVRPFGSKTDQVNLQGKVAIVVNGATRTGRQCCLYYASLGVKVVVHDLFDPIPVVREIERLGGCAIGVQSSLLDGKSIVKAALDAYGCVDILINDATLSDDLGSVPGSDPMADTNLNSALKHVQCLKDIAKVLWPHFHAQKSGKIVTITHPSDVLPRLDQLSHTMARWALLGLSRSLACEGAENNIRVGVVIPNAVRSPHTNGDILACITRILSCDTNGSHSKNCAQVYEINETGACKTVWQRSGGFQFPLGSHATPEALLKMWGQVVCFDDNRTDCPVDHDEGSAKIMAHISSQQ
ncbi:peroxisomal multifunctional beta-oxidation protein [Alternaria burnsii]|uniref:Peroxisomal multifunctional beta-oxidation protein n=1 Tax=Alternaria burnsii TaxID=1187904 RepID=A0A8H7E9U0_9PLEO|nr:peroxisomal multifunctional beta-oxidation protein [Alternaria burnsii]KAF7671839.1 peroxisomal multifunctional beta-oxidation protein [Alternaria burnsii]CAI9630961.1 unnamed protein product [Alternaria burnsii]